MGTGENRWRLILATFVEVEGKVNWEIFIRSSLEGISHSENQNFVKYPCDHFIFFSEFHTAGIKMDAVLDAVKFLSAPFDESEG